MGSSIRQAQVQTAPAASIVDRPVRVSAVRVDGEVYLEVVDAEDGLLHAALQIVNHDLAADLLEQFDGELVRVLSPIPVENDDDEDSSRAERQPLELRGGAL